MKTIQKIYEHYKALKGIWKWIISFLLNWVYWGFIYFFIYYVFPVEAELTRSIKEYLVTVTIGAVMWTIIYNINYRRLFGKVNKDRNVQVSDTRDDE
jgi:hypothetical protein